MQDGAATKGKPGGRHPVDVDACAHGLERPALMRNERGDQVPAPQGEEPVTLDQEVLERAWLSMIRRAARLVARCEGGATTRA